MSLITRGSSRIIMTTTTTTVAAFCIAAIAFWVGGPGGGGGGRLLSSFFSTTTAEGRRNGAGGTDDESESELIPLHFEFQGYSIWLELEQIDGDLDLALNLASQDLNVHRIPKPHVTVEYGMTHLSQQVMMENFDKLTTIINDYWPPFHVKGIHTDITFDGIDSEIMSMAWIEMTLGSSQQHQKLINEVHRVFYDDNDDDENDDNSKLTKLKWKPHLSLVYENPDQAKLNLHYSMTIMKRIPTLTSVSKRQVIAISLWKTQGKMESWKQLKRYEFNTNN